MALTITVRRRLRGLVVGYIGGFTGTLLGLSIFLH